MSRGGLVHASIFPHPPIMVPAVGSAAQDLEKTRPTREAAQRLAREIAAAHPETIILVTPHGPVHPHAMGLLGRPRLNGNLARFRAPQVAFTCENDPILCQRIREGVMEAGVPLLVLDQYQPAPLDHGTLVPLYFLQEAGIDAALVPLTFCYLSPAAHVRFGQVLARAIAQSGKRVAFVASGDLSHRLIPGAPAGYNPRGQDFDRIVMEALGQADWQTIHEIDPDLVEEAGECGYRSLLILSGVLADQACEPSVLSYDAPYGVGYPVVAMPPGPGGQVTSDGPAVMQTLDLSGPVALARQAVENWTLLGRKLAATDDLPEQWRRQAGVFVTIKNGGELRGCIGTYRPTHGNICSEILHNAVLAASQDPRFPPITTAELAYLTYTVSILDPIESVNSQDELDPLRYGVVVRAGDRQGLLLPNIAPINTVSDQLAHARVKAGIGPDEPVWIYRFTTREYLAGESLDAVSTVISADVPLPYPSRGGEGIS